MSVTGNAGSGSAVGNVSQKRSLLAPPFLNLVHSVSDSQEPPRAELGCSWMQVDSGANTLLLPYVLTCDLWLVL